MVLDWLNGAVPDVNTPSNLGWFKDAVVTVRTYGDADPPHEPG